MPSHGLPFSPVASRPSVWIMGIDRGAPEWPYQQLAARLREQIRSGQIGRQLPSVAFLSQDTGLSPKTVQKAIRVLESEGLVHTYPNRGSFVAERPDP